MARRRNPVVQAVTTGFTLLFIQVSRRLPLQFNRWFAVRVARLVAPLIPRVRRITRENLDRAYGDTLTDAEKTKIYRGAIDSVALVAAEFAHMTRMETSPLGSQVTVKGIENIVPGQGHLCVAAHLGNWEVAGPFMARKGLKVAEVVRPFDDPRMDRAIDAVRTTEDVTTIPKDNAGKEIIRLLKDGYMVGVLIDQSPRDSAVPVTFFDAPCWATIAPVMIAVRAKVPLLPMGVIRNPDYSYTLEFFKPIEISRTGNLREDLVTNSQRCQDVIEKIVRAYPEQWLWLHRRWKERPRLAEEWSRKVSKDKAARRAKDGDLPSEEG